MARSDTECESNSTVKNEFYLRDKNRCSVFSLDNSDSKLPTGLFTMNYLNRQIVCESDPNELCDKNGQDKNYNLIFNSNVPLMNENIHKIENADNCSNSDCHGKGTMVLSTDLPVNSHSLIAGFFKGRSVLITGGLGFMGKVLVEKILRSCPEVQTLYLLVRNKRGFSARSRLESKLLKSKVLDRVRLECPASLDKLVAIEGDITMPDLGMSCQDLSRVLDKVSVVFHVAATVSFNQTLRLATKMNLEGTKNTAQLAMRMTNLQAFVHVSTAFSNSNRTDVEEIVYPTKMKPEEYLQFIKALTDEELIRMTPELISGHPNTYTFTKLMAENYLSQHCPDLPWTIVRPAAVICSWKEPFPGWVDNKFGPTGLILALGTGAVHALQADASMAFEIIPVDIGINHMIAAVWDRATNASSLCRVYNGSSSPFKKFNLSEFRRLCYEAIHEYPLEHTYRYPSCIVTRSRTLYKLLSFFQHYVPAVFLDLYFLATGQKPKVVGAYNKILSYLEDYVFFNTTPWKFHSKELSSLQERLSPVDREVFNLLVTHLEWRSFCKDACLGIRRYLMHEDDSSLPKSRERLWSLYYRGTAIQASMIAVAACIVWNQISFLFST